MTQVSKHDIDSIIRLHKGIVSGLRTIGLIQYTSPLDEHGRLMGEAFKDLAYWRDFVSGSEYQLDTLLSSLKDQCDD